MPILNDYGKYARIAIENLNSRVGDYMFSAELLIALKDALSSIYWTKQDLRFFIQNTVSHQEVVAYIDWSQTKYESCSQLIDYMSKRQETYQNDIYSLINKTVQMKDFSHLKRWDNGEALIARARESVSRLERISKQHRADFCEQITVQQKRNNNQERLLRTIDYQKQIDNLRARFLEIVKEPPQQRGYSLESFLTDLFSFFDLAPRGAFKIKGEQIDGAFTHEGTDYLLEAKWRNEPSPNADLYTFAGKIYGKLKNTLGVFISMSGYSRDALESNSHVNKSMILVDGQDIMMILENRISLPDMIRIKRRHAAETGEIMFRIQLS